VDDQYLMILFTGFTAWQNYAATQLAEAEVVEARADALVRFLEAKAMVTNWSKDDKVTVARAEILVSPEVEEARSRQLVAYAHRKMTQVIYTNCERSAALVSRELTRRVGRDPIERRNTRWNP
jgi:ABC-type nitrate/sulfonate/bicarbonate transport system substrate-binding protein